MTAGELFGSSFLFVSVRFGFVRMCKD